MRIEKAKYKIGATVLARIGCDMFRVKVMYRWHTAEGYIYKVGRVCNHAGLRVTSSMEIDECDIVEQLENAPAYDNRGWSNLFFPTYRDKEYTYKELRRMRVA